MLFATIILLAATTGSAGEIQAKVTPTESQAALLPGWLADLNAGLCQQARLPAGCKTEQLQQAAQRADVRIYATLDEWASEVLLQAVATVNNTIHAIRGR